MRHGAGVMGAIDEEAPGPHGGQAFLAEPDPVLVGQGRDGDVQAGDARQVGGIGFIGVQRLDHRAVGEGFFDDQHGLGAAVQLQRGGGVDGLRLGERDRGFPQGR